MRNFYVQGTWLVLLVEHRVLDLRIVSSNSTLGMQPTFEKKIINNNNKIK